jgi:hypothetical protein
MDTTKVLWEKTKSRTVYIAEVSIQVITVLSSTVSNRPLLRIRDAKLLMRCSNSLILTLVPVTIMNGKTCLCTIEFESLQSLLYVVMW